MSDIMIISFRYKENDSMIFHYISKNRHRTIFKKNIHDIYLKIILYYKNHHISKNHSKKYSLFFKMTYCINNVMISIVKNHCDQIFYDLILQMSSCYKKNIILSRVVLF